MRRRLRFATVLLAAGGALLMLALVALLILQLAGVSVKYDVLLSLAGIGTLALVLGAVMYAATLSHKKSHRFLSEERGRTMHSHGGGQDREKLEGETERRI